MINAFKVIVVTTGLILVLAASTNNSTEHSKEQLLLDDLYACQWWPFCRDPELQSPLSVPSDSSAPKPAGDKDTTKDKKDAAQLA